VARGVVVASPDRYFSIPHHDTPARRDPQVRVPPVDPTGRTVIEALGYLASAVVVLSLTMSSVVRLRIIGLVGAALFSIYGILVGAIPVAVTNLVIMGLHIYFLRRLLGDDEQFTLLEVSGDSAYLEQFLEFHRTEIEEYQPLFTHDPGAARRTVFVLRDMVPAGLLIGHTGTEGALEVDLDFVIPQYRDLRPAQFLFGASAETFAAWGVDRLVATASTEGHRRYLTKVGFEPIGGDRYLLDLAAVGLRGRRGGGMRPSGHE